MAWSGPTLLGSHTSSTGALSKSITGVTAAVGSLVIFSGASWTAAAATAMSASDSAGNSWGFRCFKSSSQNCNTWIAWSVLTSALSGGTITVSSSSNNLLSTYMGAVSFTGQATGTVEDTSVQANVTNLAGTNSPSLTSGTPSVTGDLMVAAMGEFLTTADTFTEDTGNGWSTLYDGAQPNIGHWSFSYQINAGSGAKTYNPTVGASASNNFSLLTAGFLVGGAASNPTFSMSGTGAANAVAASLLAATGAGALSPKVASVLSSAGAGLVAAVAASAMAASGTGAFSARQSAAFATSGIGSFNAVPVVTGFSFAITGAGTASFRAASKLSAVGAGAFNPVKYSQAEGFVMGGGCSVSFLGSTFKWDQVAGATNTWTPGGDSSSTWTPKTSSSSRWDRIH